MIIGNSSGEQLTLQENPHSFLPNPCDLDTASDVNAALRLIKPFTTYISAKDFEVSDTAEMIKLNDRIKVSMTVDKEGHINMDYGEVLGIVERAEGNKSIEACGTLSGLFESNTVSALGDVSPDSSGLNDYANLDDSVCDENNSDFYLIHP